MTGGNRPPYGIAPIALAFMALGCGSGFPDEDPRQETGYPLAVFHDSCSPVDGPAQVLALTHDPVAEPYGWGGAFLTVDVFQPPFLEQPGVHEAEGADIHGAARRCDGEGNCQLAIRFRLRVDGVAADGSVKGYVQADFGPDDLVAGPFSAPEIPFESFCP